jgi:hypothetical protein
MKISIDSSIREMLASGDYQGADTLYNLRYFPLMDGRLLTITFASPKNATVGVVIDKNKQFSITINDYYYTETPKDPQSSGPGLFDDTEQIQDNKLGSLVEEALVFFENMFDLEQDARQHENIKRHETARKELLDQL